MIFADLAATVATPTFALGVVVGPPVWTFFEYVLHRFWMHEAKGKNYASKEHLRHHASEDTVLESWYLSWAGVLLVGFALIPFLGRLVGWPTFGWGLGVGWVVGYGFYDWVHWRAHRRPIRNGYEAWLRRHHFFHHFHAPMKNHGVTTPVWDMVFGTYVRAERIAVPRRLAMRWLVDAEGRVRPEYADQYELRGHRPLDAEQKQLDWDLAFANEAPVV